jgi:hypothetical protein
MRKILAAAGSVVALVGFAGVAHSSATIDLIWDANDTNEINDSERQVVQLNVILTAGPNGSEGAAVNVNFSSVARIAVLDGFVRFVSNTPSLSFDEPLPLVFDNTPRLNVGNLQVEVINSTCICDAGAGIGLAAGQSHQLGTVTFDTARVSIGTYEIQSNIEGVGLGVLDGDTNVIPEGEITLNSAFLVISTDPIFGQRHPRWRHPR